MTFASFVRLVFAGAGNHPIYDPMGDWDRFSTAKRQAFLATKIDTYNNELLNVKESKLFSSGRDEFYFTIKSLHDEHFQNRLSDDRQIEESVIETVLDYFFVDYDFASARGRGYLKLLASDPIASKLLPNFINGTLTKRWAVVNTAKKVSLEKDAVILEKINRFRAALREIGPGPGSTREETYRKITAIERYTG
jgi:hypothetical protein